MNDTGKPSPYGLNKNSVDYWETHRNKISDLYYSEEYFFIPTVKKIKSVLDLGCAAGGFASIVRAIKDNVSYLGLDVSDFLIERAKLLHPNASFMLYNGYLLPDVLTDYDLVFSFGVLHHVPDWRQLVSQMLQYSNKYVLFDLRLTLDATINDINISYQKMQFNQEWDGHTVVPYVVNNIKEVIEGLLSLKCSNDTVNVFGYQLPPTELAVTTYRKVLMTSILIEKNSESPGLVCNIK